MEHYVWGERGDLLGPLRCCFPDSRALSMTLLWTVWHHSGPRAGVARTRKGLKWFATLLCNSARIEAHPLVSHP